MALLTKDQILKADDLKKETVKVPEWGGDVIVQTMTGAARDDYENSIVDLDAHGKAKHNLSNIRAKLLAATLVDEKGSIMFKAKDIVALGNKSSAALDRVFGVAQRLNAVSDEDLEELAKN
jgi:hypothetical protein